MTVRVRLLALWSHLLSSFLDLVPDTVCERSIVACVLRAASLGAVLLPPNQPSARPITFTTSVAE